MSLVETHPNRISWDITNWRKLWNSPIEPPLSTIQISTYEYSEPDRNLARRDADKVRVYITYFVSAILPFFSGK